MLPTVFPTDSELALYKALRQADLIKYDNPDDDHPNLAVTSAILRHKLRQVLDHTQRPTPVL